MKRRDFLQSTAILAGGAAFGVAPAALSEPTPSALQSAARVRVAVIGPGSRGTELVRQMLRIPGVEIAAVCDIYQPRFAHVQEVIGHAVPTHTDYRELLKRKDVDAVIVATPPALHREIVIASLESGRPVFGEKVMGVTLEDNRAIVQAVKATGKMYQVDHEYRYAPWFIDSIRRIHAGEIGNVTHVYGYWHRNNSWRRSVPDPKFERLINWRLYKDTSMGLLAELGSHMVDTANWVFGEMPESVMASGSIGKYHDGRENDDNVQAIYSYSKGRRFVFSALANNSNVGNQIWVYGDKGSVQLTIVDATFFYEPKEFEQLPLKAEAATKGWKTGASYNPSAEMPYRGAGTRVPVANPEDATLTSCRAFIDCVRSGKRPVADEHVGYAAAVSIALGYQAKEEERLVRFPADVRAAGQVSSERL